jgi:hypothetical protein
VSQIEELIIKLQQIGYRTQTFGERVIVEFGAQARVSLSAKQLEKLLPYLASGHKPAQNTFKPNGPRKRKRITVKRQKRAKVRAGRVRAKSAETRRHAKWSGAYQGGLPGLGKHH